MKNFLKGSSVLLIGDLLTKILSVVYLIPLAYIDSEIATLMAYLLIPFSLMIVFSTLGINMILSAEIVKYHNKDQDKLNRALITGGLILALITVICSLGMYYGAEVLVGNMVIGGSSYEYYPELVKGTKILSVALAIFTFTAYIRTIFISLGDYSVVSATYVSEQIIKIAGVLGLSWYFLVYKGEDVGMSVEIIAWTIIVSMLSTLLIFMYKFFKNGYYKLFTQGTYKFEMTMARFIVISSLVFFSTSLYTSAFDQIDMFLFSFLLPDTGMSNEQIASVTGEYFTYSMKVVMIPIQLSSSFISVMIREVHTKEQSKARSFDNIITVILLYSAVMMIGVWSVGTYVLDIMYPKETLTGIIVAQALIIPFYILRNIIGGYVATNDASKTSIVIGSLATIGFKYIFDVMLVPVFGVNGFIISSVLAIIISIAIFVIPNKKLFITEARAIREKTMIVFKTIIIILIMMIIMTFTEMLFTNSFVLLVVNGVSVLVLGLIMFFPNFKKMQ